MTTKNKTPNLFVVEVTSMRCIRTLKHSEPGLVIADQNVSHRNRAISKFVTEKIVRVGKCNYLTQRTSLLKFRDPDAVPQLKKIIQSKHVQKWSPGTVRLAKEALKRCGGKL